MPKYHHDCILIKKLEKFSKTLYSGLAEARKGAETGLALRASGRKEHLRPDQNLMLCTCGVSAAAQ